jgi:hypothetical protein
MNMLLRTILGHGAVLACAVLALAELPAVADDKKDDKGKSAPSGVWVLKGGELRIEFSDKGVMKVSPHGKDEVIVVVCKYTVEKDGRVKATITELDGKEKAKAAELIPVGLEFNFKWQAKEGTATLDDLKGEKVDALKSHLEGKYEQKK